jgi:hypothetical protein
MTQKNKATKLWLALLVTAILLAALPATALAQDEDLVRFRVINRAERGITIRLYATDGSGRAYYMRVEALSTKDMSPIRGQYTYRLTACGIMVTGKLDLSKPMTWINPECGEKGGAGTKAPNTMDVGKDILKLVKIKLVNKTPGDMRIWLEGPYPYMFDIPFGGSLTVSIRKGSYVWHHYECDGQYQSGNLFANNTKTRVIECD